MCKKERQTRGSHSEDMSSGDEKRGVGGMNRQQPRTTLKPLGVCQVKQIDSHGVDWITVPWIEKKRRGA